MFLKIKGKVLFFQQTVAKRQYLQHFRNTLTDFNKNLFDITGHSLWRWYKVLRPSRFHKASKSAIVNDFKWAFTLSNPAYDFGPMSYWVS